MISVIGGSGFLGSSVVKKLLDCNQLVGCFDIKPSHINVPYTSLDVTQCGSEADFAGSTCLINLAAVHRDDVRPLSRYYDVNVEGAKRVCASATLSGVNQIIFTSSVAVYGFAPPDTGEDGEANYFNEYGRTKFLAEQVYSDWQRVDPTHRSLIIVRPTVIFGPGNRGNVFNLLRQIASGKFAMFGDGENIKSMAYVENVAGFLIHALSMGPGIHIYNYIDKPDLTMNQLVGVARATLFNHNGVGLRFPAFLGVAIGFGVDLIARATGRNFSISSIRVKKFMATTQFSSRASETGYAPTYTLAEGFKETLRYEFLEDNLDKPTFETE